MAALDYSSYQWDLVIPAFAQMQAGVGRRHHPSRRLERTTALGSAERLAEGGSDLAKPYQKQSSTRPSNYSAPTGKPNLTPTLPDLKDKRGLRGTLI